MFSTRYKKYSILLLLISATYHFANGMVGTKELPKKLGNLKESLTELKSKLTLVQGKLESLQSKLAQPVGHAAPPPPPPMPDFGSKKPGVPDSGHTKEKKHVDLMAHIRGEGGTGTPKLKPVSKSGVTKAPAGLRDLFKQRSETVREALTLADDDFNSRIVDVSKLGTLDGTVQELVVLMDSADSQERLKKFVDVFIKIVKKENFFKLEQEFGEEDEALNLRGYLISEKLDEIIEFIKKIVEFFPDEKNGLLAGIKILEKYKVDYSEHIEKGRKAAELQREAKEQSDQKRAEEQRIVAVEKERIQKALAPAENLISKEFTNKELCGISLSAAFTEIKEFIKKAATIQDVNTINEKIDEAKEIFEGRAVQKAVKDSVKPLIKAFFAAWDSSYEELMTPAKEQKKTEPVKQPAAKPVPPARSAKKEKQPVAAAGPVEISAEESELIRSFREREVKQEKKKEEAAAVHEQEIKQNAETLENWTLIIKPIPQIEESVLREVLKKLNTKDLLDLKQRVTTRKASKNKKQDYENGMFEIIEKFPNK